MKIKLVMEIIKNIGRLLRFDFWKASFNDPSTALSLVWVTIFVGFADIVKILLISKYPSKDGGVE